MAEWLKAPVLKTGKGKLFASSNLAPSAELQKHSTSVEILPVKQPLKNYDEKNTINEAMKEKKSLNNLDNWICIVLGLLILISAKKT